jgi:protein-S-isoprenylcysteine O-methyltransferase Ste14
VTVPPDPAGAPAPRPPAFSERVGAAVLAAAWAAAPFAAAGTLRWPAGWTWLAVVAGGLLAHRAFVASRSPGLIERRDRIGAGTRGWDLAWVALFWPLMLAAPVAAGIDAVRLGHPPLPAWLVAPGVALFAAGLSLSALAMAANPFFEGTARIQPDQRVVDAGPYRRLRHPGYAGLLLWALSGPPLLRSALALVPGVLAAAWVVVRTALEDRMLRRGLAGYEAYAGRVRWRLLPGAW